MSGIVFDYNNINAKLNCIDKEIINIERISEIFYNITILEAYKAYNTTYPTYQELSEEGRQFHRNVTLNLIAHGYNP